MQAIKYKIRELAYSSFGERKVRNSLLAFPGCEQFAGELTTEYAVMIYRDWARSIFICQYGLVVFHELARFAEIDGCKLAIRGRIPRSGLFKIVLDDSGVSFAICQEYRSNLLISAGDLRKLRGLINVY
jgi:hypothetical protein